MQFVGQTVIPISIIVGLSALAGLACHPVWSRFWLASIVAALTASAFWGAGVYLLLWLNAPNELGRPLPGPILLTLLITFLSASLTVGSDRIGFFVNQTTRQVELWKK